MAAPSSNGPVPSKHIFIHQLSKQEVDAKVRFLSCVIGYNESTGLLMVEHNYPRNTSRRLSTKAIIDVNLLLETIKTDILQPGSWVNVIGYVQQKSLPKTRRSMSSLQKAFEEPTRVQAVLLWSAGAVRVEDYEKTLEEHLSVIST